MTLQLPQPPDGALRSVLTALVSPTALRHVTTPALRTPDPAHPPVPQHPLAVHLLRPGVALANAPRTGWRFLISCGDEVVAAAETQETADGHAFSHFAEGPYLVATLRALQQARRAAAGAAGPHEPRLLSVPSLYTAALWLHALRPGGTDLLIPLAPAPLGIAAHRVYPAGELLRLFRRAVSPPVQGATGVPPADPDALTVAGR
ncbi:hypothetical protein [Peterkaempfera griseoplana]|uniref:hypothetical protein n=1 Tax=Peterkaempfera griseoplana TaxID=66896 RepID=UPI0006E30B80|nr:hypothetical protein [Peterkaempfera griseoplana]